MRFHRVFVLNAVILALTATGVQARINVVVVHNNNEAATGGFKLRVISAPSAEDAASKASISIIDGQRDPNGGEVEKLQDGRVPTEPDQPGENFFFAAGSEGGRLLLDLGSPRSIDQVNTYSWHPNTRGPQVYKLYASDGTGEAFNRQPGRDTDLAHSGWKLVAEVDIRPADSGVEEDGGQFGVSVFDSEGPVGPYRYLLFDISRTESRDPFGNTFYSEIDVLASPAEAGHPEDTGPAGPKPYAFTIENDHGSFEATIDTAETPDLSQWAKEELAPVVKEWYPKIVTMLPSDGYAAPRRFSIRFSPEYRGVAATGGSRVTCAPAWFRQNLQGEAKGAVVHELVHVVQQYGRARRRDPDATRPPGWLVEGIADYIRWFLYEPETGGANITARNFERARYDGSYRITANFLNWVTHRYDKDLVPKLNAAIREGRYKEALWTDYTGRTLTELDNEWRASLAKSLGKDQAESESLVATDGNVSAEPELLTSGESSAGETHNALTDEEKAAGWKLLFDGKTLDGWHTFRQQGVRPGWQIKDGVLSCVDPSDAGDLCTDGEYDWFELRLEYNISEGGNSGIMFHVSDRGGTAWATGPELQLQDNVHGHDPIKTGWLYALYQPPDDPQTGKPLDATKSAGQWNQVTLRIAPEKCVHEINGVKYLEYKLGSDDFLKRVADSKFGRMRRFAKTHKGYIALQGDHGQVSFRNIKIRPIESSDQP